MPASLLPASITIWALLPVPVEVLLEDWLLEVVELLCTLRELLLTATLELLWDALLEAPVELELWLCDALVFDELLDALPPVGAPVELESVLCDPQAASPMHDSASTGNVDCRINSRLPVRDVVQSGHDLMRARRGWEDVSGLRRDE
jgi:hypothetical protein